MRGDKKDINLVLNVNITKSLDEILHDIKNTKDPIKLVLLKKIYALKVTQTKQYALDIEQQYQPDEALDIDFTGDDELDETQKMKAYQDVVYDNEKEANMRIIEKKRGGKEHIWENGGIYDPKYVRYQKEDAMNNSLMERLNSEIGFRLDSNNKVKIEKPFEDNENRDDLLNDIARYTPVVTGRKSIRIRR